MKDRPKLASGGIDIASVKGLLFDVDGTLSDTDDVMVEKVRSFLEPASWLFKDKDPTSFSRRLVMAGESPMNFLYGLADRIGVDEPLMKVYERFLKNKKKNEMEEGLFLMISGVREMLTHLARRFPLGVVSARDEKSTFHFLDYFELTQFFKVIVTSQTCRHTKPYPEPVIYAAGELGLPPDACVMIGDTIVDIRAGKSAGAQTVAVLCGFGTHRELHRAGADMILGNTDELTDLFSG
jgi:HAD superfamily hydrolase (TIGR01549 family)